MENDYLGHWKSIIQQCNSRSAGSSVRQWLSERNISDSQYLYWARRLNSLSKEDEKEIQQYWKELVIQYKHRPAGMSGKQWISHHGLSASMFYSWYQKLNKKLEKDEEKEELDKYWIGVIDACMHRPKGVSISDWLKMNNINRDTYYYHYRRLKYSSVLKNKGIGIIEEQLAAEKRGYWEDVAERSKTRPADMSMREWLKENGISQACFYRYAKKYNLDYKKTPSNITSKSNEPGSTDAQSKWVCKDGEALCSIPILEELHKYWSKVVAYAESFETPGDLQQWLRTVGIDFKVYSFWSEGLHSGFSRSMFKNLVHWGNLLAEGNEVMQSDGTLIEWIYQKGTSKRTYYIYRKRFSTYDLDLGAFGKVSKVTFDSKAVMPTSAGESKDVFQTGIAAEVRGVEERVPPVFHHKEDKLIKEEEKVISEVKQEFNSQAVTEKPMFSTAAVINGGGIRVAISNDASTELLEKIMTAVSQLGTAK